MSNIRSLAELQKTARELHARQKAAETQGITPSSTAVPEKDPNEQGVVSIPNHPDGDDKKKLQVPEGEPTTATAQPDGVTTETKPSGAGSGDVPATRDGNALDARFTEPNTDLSKIAGQAQAILGKLSQLSAKLPTKSASANQQPTGIAPKPEAKGAPAKTEAPAQPEKKATGDDLEGMEDYCAKVAGYLKQTEGGIERFESFLKEECGVKVASEIIAGAQQERDAFLAAQYAQAEAQQKIAYVVQAEAASLEQELAKMTPAQLDHAVKTAQTHIANLEKLAAKAPELAEAYRAAMEDAEHVVQAAVMGAEAPAIPGGDGEIAPDQIMALIQELVASGQLDPALAEQLLAQIAGGGAEAPAEGGEVAPEAAPEAEEGSEEEKLASFVQKLI